MTDENLLELWVSVAEGTGMVVERVHVLHDEPEIEGCECVHYHVGDVSGSFLVAPEGTREERRNAVVFLVDHSNEHSEGHARSVEDS